MGGYTSMNPPHRSLSKMSVYVEGPISYMLRLSLECRDSPLWLLGLTDVVQEGEGWGFPTDGWSFTVEFHILHFDVSSLVFWLWSLEL